MLLLTKKRSSGGWSFSLVLMNYCAVWADSTTNWAEINEICGISYANRIVGGTRAALGQFPWIAHLGIMRHDSAKTFTLSYECGGSLIHPRYVITAAHCVIGLEDGESLTVVKLGEHDLETAIDCEDGQCADPPQIIYAKNIFVPKEFDSLTLKHDVALIELSETANITDFVSPVCLPTGELVHKSLLNEIVEVAGWGWFDPDEPRSSTVLQVVKLPVTEIERCRKIKQLKHYDFTGGQICVGGVEGKDSCNGDSGGPLVKALLADPDQGPRYFLFGLVSFGIPSCGKFPTPAVYRNVSHYLPWVFANIKD